MSDELSSSAGAAPVDCSRSFVVSRSLRDSLRSMRTAISALWRSISSNVDWLMRTSSTVGLRARRGRSGHVLEDRHLAEEVALLERREELLLAAPAALVDLHRAGLDDEHLRADLALLEDGLAGGEAREVVREATRRAGLDDDLHGPRSLAEDGRLRCAPQPGVFKSDSFRGKGGAREAKPPESDSGRTISRIL